MYLTSNILINLADWWYAYVFYFHGNDIINIAHFEAIIIFFSQENACDCNVTMAMHDVTTALPWHHVFKHNDMIMCRQDSASFIYRNKMYLYTVRLALLITRCWVTMIEPQTCFMQSMIKCLDAKHNQPNSLIWNIFDVYVGYTI